MRCMNYNDKDWNMPNAVAQGGESINPYQFASMLIAGLLVFGGLGWLLDETFHTTPLWLIVGVLYAIAGSFVILVYRSRKKP